jgi:hypothetical protein
VVAEGEDHFLLAVLIVSHFALQFLLAAAPAKLYYYLLDTNN